MSTTSVIPWAELVHLHPDEVKERAETDISSDAEQSALGKLLAIWSAVIEGQQVKPDKLNGQERLL